MWSTTPSHGDRGHATISCLSSTHATPGAFNHMFSASISRLGGDRWDSEIRIFSLSPGSLEPVTLGAVALAETGTSCNAWTANNEHLVVGCDDGSVRLVRSSAALEGELDATPSWNEVWSSSTEARTHNVDVSAVAPHPREANKIVTAASDGEICAIDIHKPSEMSFTVMLDHLDVHKITALEWISPSVFVGLTSEGVLAFSDQRGAKLDTYAPRVTALCSAGAGKEHELLVGCVSGELSWIDLRRLQSNESDVQLRTLGSNLRPASSRGPIRCLSATCSPSVPEERFILSGSDDGSLECTREMGMDYSRMFRKKHRDFVRGACFVGGAVPVTAGYDGRLLVHGELTIV